MYKILLSIAIIFATVCNTQAQYLFPYNLDFERGSVGTPPPGWQLNSNYSKSGYILSTENSDGLIAGKCVMFKTPTILTEKKAAAFFQSFDASKYISARLKINAKLKTEFKGSESFAKMWINVKDVFGTSVAYAESREFKSSLWDTIGVDINIPLCAKTISIGFTASGIGSVNIDDIAIIDIRPNTEINKSLVWNKDKNEYLKSAANILSAIKYYSNNMNDISIDQAELLRATIMLADKANSTKEFIAGASKLFTKIENEFKIYSKDENIPVKNENIINSDPYLAKMVKGVDMTFVNDFSGAFPVEISKPLKADAAGLSQNVALDKLPENAEYILTFKAKADKKYYSTIAGAAFRFETAGKAPIEKYSFEEKNIGSDLKEYQIKGKAPKGAAFLSILLSLWGDGAVYFDDITLEYKSGSNIKNVVLANGDFEDFAENFIPAWNCPVPSADYTIRSTDKPISGKRSLEIKSSDRFVLAAPLPNENYIFDIGFDFKGCFPYAKKPSPAYFYCENKEQDPVFHTGTKYDVKDLYFRLGGVVELRNKLLNFGILKLSQTSLDSAFFEAISSAAKASNEKDYLSVLNKFLTVYPDNIASITKNSDSKLHCLPFTFTKIEDKYFVNSKIASYDQVEYADEIIDIDNKPIEEYIKSIMSEIPGNNELFKINRAIAKIRLGELGENIEFTIKNSGGSKKIKASKTASPFDFTDSELKPVDEVDDWIVYLDLTGITDENFKQIIPQLQKAKSIIFDARGTSLMQEFFLGLFTDSPIVPVNVYVNHYFGDSFKYKSKFNLAAVIKSIGKLKDIKIAFLTDSRTDGMSELIVNTVRINGLGKIFGTPSAGAPGAPVFSELIGDYLLNFNTAEYYSPDEFFINGNSVVPDIQVLSTINDFKLKRDAVLQSAIEYLKTNK